MGKNYFAKSILKKALDAAGLPTTIVPHSIRATTATQLYRAGVEEQLICETTGHRSLAVRGYKHSSEEQTMNVQQLLVPNSNQSSSIQTSTSYTTTIGAQGQPSTINSVLKQANLKDCTIHVHYNN